MGIIVKKQCEALTKAGFQCKRSVKVGNSKYCAIHSIPKNREHIKKMQEKLTQKEVMDIMLKREDRSRIADVNSSTKIIFNYPNRYWAENFKSTDAKGIDDGSEEAIKKYGVSLKERIKQEMKDRFVSSPKSYKPTPKSENELLDIIKSKMKRAKGIELQYYKSCRQAIFKNHLSKTRIGEIVSFAYADLLWKKKIAIYPEDKKNILFDSWYSFILKELEMKNITSTTDISYRNTKTILLGRIMRTYLIKHSTKYWINHKQKSPKTLKDIQRLYKDIHKMSLKSSLTEDKFFKFIEDKHPKKSQGYKDLVKKEYNRFLSAQGNYFCSDLMKFDKFYSRVLKKLIAIGVKVEDSLNDLKSFEQIYIALDSSPSSYHKITGAIHVSNRFLTELNYTIDKINSEMKSKYKIGKTQSKKYGKLYRKQVNQRKTKEQKKEEKQHRKHIMSHVYHT